MFSNRVVFVVALYILSGCGDIVPSSSDKRAPVECGISGPSVCQLAPDFTVSDSLGNPVTLYSLFPTNKGVVLYFTMWCSTCDSRMMYMRDFVIPQNPDIVFLAVDFVSGSVYATHLASSGYEGSGFIVLADADKSVLNAYKGAMDMTVVIDNTGVVRMNEYFKTDKLQSVLAGLP